MAVHRSAAPPAPHRSCEARGEDGITQPSSDALWVRALAQSGVVIVTGSNPPADRRETLAMGADASVVKPSHLNAFMH